MVWSYENNVTKDFDKECNGDKSVWKEKKENVTVLFLGIFSCRPYSNLVILSFQLISLVHSICLQLATNLYNVCRLFDVFFCIVSLYSTFQYLNVWRHDLFYLPFLGLGVVFPLVPLLIVYFGFSTFLILFSFFFVVL